MGRIITQLKGGLGNQLFQYSTARSLSLQSSLPLYLDVSSGFIRDRQYRRHFELNVDSLNCRLLPTLQTYPAWVYLLVSKYKLLPSQILKPFGNFIVDRTHDPGSPLSSIKANADNWLIGYWQQSHHLLPSSPFSRIIISELVPPKPTDSNILRLGEFIRSQRDSLAIGIRLYEESSNPFVHSKNGLPKTPQDFNSILDLLSTQLPGLTPFVFCTHRSDYISQLKLPENTIYVTHDDGFNGTSNRLWLLSQCKHHLFNNSTFYWWGALFSSLIHSPKTQRIFAANNFKSEQIYIDNWTLF